MAVRLWARWSSAANLPLWPRTGCSSGRSHLNPWQRWTAWFWAELDQDRVVVVCCCWQNKWGAHKLIQNTANRICIRCFVKHGEQHKYLFVIIMIKVTRVPYFIKRALCVDFSATHNGLAEWHSQRVQLGWCCYAQHESRRGCGWFMIYHIIQGGHINRDGACGRNKKWLRHHHPSWVR